MSNRKISYTDRDFASLRQDLIDYTQQYYPDLINNFNDASLFSVFLDLNAGIGDNLHHHIDRSLQETVLQYAQQKSSIFNIARTYGLKIPGVRPSISLVDISITVPAFGDAEDDRYLGILRAGSQFLGAGEIFEVPNDVNFGSQFNSQGFPNRIKIPNFDANNRLINYTITKREVVVNGVTKIFKRVINTPDAVPFFEFFLPEKNVVSITSVIEKEGVNYQSPPSYDEFFNENNRWYEVDALAEDRIFIEDPTKQSDSPGIKVGRYIQTDTRFISEYTPEGYCKLTFGGSKTTPEEQLNSFTNSNIPINISEFQNNIGLGTTVKPNTTLFIKYRVGGGRNSNVGVNVINQVGNINFAISGPSNSINRNVINSISVNNVTAAIGGGDLPTTEEVRHMTTFNFAAQKRAVTIDDYNSLIRTMPSRFGAPAKASIKEVDNKIIIEILSIDNNGKLTQEVSNTLKNNITTYLSNYRMINDYISIRSAKVVDISFEIDVILETDESQSETISNIINSLNNYLNPQRQNLGQNVNVSDINRFIQDIPNIYSVSDIKIFNKVGGQYSSSETTNPYIDEETREIRIIDGTIFADSNEVYQIRFPNKDINVRVKTIND